jgi:plastocyanin
MKWRALAIGWALALLALVAAAAAWGASAHRSQSPVAIGVAQREFRITAYRKTVTPGPVRLNVQNYGEDTHNLVVTGPRGYVLLGPDIDSGDRATVTATLKRPGTYQLLCTRANHLQLGMKARLTVRRKPR